MFLNFTLLLLLTNEADLKMKSECEEDPMVQRQNKANQEEQRDGEEQTQAAAAVPLVPTR
jgi:hypothetical protein